MDRFYKEDLKENEKLIVLSQEESHHIVKVLRKTAGSLIELTDGRGKIITGEIVSSKKKQLTIKPIKTVYKKKLFPEITILISALPSEKIDFSVQKLTELGTDRIVIFFSKRSKIKPYKEKNKKIERLKKIAVSAIKQSKNPYLPEIEIVDSLKTLDFSLFNLKLLFNIKGNFLIKSEMKNITKIAAVIGPEGGFDKEEIDFLKENGFKETKIAPYILRSETAAISAVSILRYIFSGDFNVR